MAILYLDRQHLEVRRDGESLALYRQGALEQRVPLRLVERVVLRGDILIHAGALTGIAARGGSVLVLPRRQNSGAVLLTRGCGPDAKRRLRQIEAATDPEWREQFARHLVRSKIRGQSRVLFRAMARRTDLRKEIGDALVRMAATEREIREQKNISASRLLGMEGAAAAAYFAAYQRLFAPALGFSGRNRRPPKDPVNACLSLAYTLLHAEATDAILCAGLDPAIGFLHEPQHGRESFSCDLVEVLRPHAEEWVWALFRNRRLQTANFKTLQGGCLLGKAGRQTFYEEFEETRIRGGKRLRLFLRAVLREWHLGNDIARFVETDIVSGTEE